MRLRTLDSNLIARNTCIQERHMLECDLEELERKNNLHHSPNRGHIYERYYMGITTVQVLRPETIKNIMRFGTKKYPTM